MSSRIISGTTPTGRLTVGNYLGAIRDWVAMQHDTESLFFAADLHAMTVAHEPANLRARTYEIIGLLLASGLDPEVCTLFVQSQVPAHSELSFLLECTAYDGELRRMIQYKEKSRSSDQVRASLLTTGRFLTIFPASVLRFSTRRPEFKVLPIELPIVRVSVGIVTLKNRTLSPVARLFIEHTREVAKSMAK